MEIFKNVMLVLLGMAIAVGLFCLVVGIGCSVNGVTFTQQIANWFGSSTTTIKDPIEEVVKAVSHTLIV